MKKIILGFLYLYNFNICRIIDKYQIIIDRSTFWTELISPEPSVSAINSEAEAIALQKPIPRN